MRGNNFLAKLWRIVYPGGTYILISNVIVAAITFALGFAVGMRNPATSIDMVEKAIYSVLDIITDLQLEMMLLSAAVTLPILVLYLRMDKIRKMGTGNWQVFEKAPVWGYLLLAIMGAAACIAFNNLISISGLMELFDGYEEVSNTLYQQKIVLEIITIGIVVPITEELIFRGLMYNRLRESMGVFGAGLISALVFAIFHWNIVQGIYAFILGLLFAAMMEHFHSVIAPIVLHVFANLISVLMTETTLLNPVYESVELFLGLTAIMLLIVCILVFVIKSKIKLKEEAF